MIKNIRMLKMVESAVREVMEACENSARINESEPDTIAGRRENGGPAYGDNDYRLKDYIGSYAYRCHDYAKENDMPGVIGEIAEICLLQGYSALVGIDKYWEKLNK